MAILKVKNAHIFKRFSNFDGRPDNFHPNGAMKNFALVLDEQSDYFYLSDGDQEYIHMNRDQFVDQLNKDGWLVKELSIKDEMVPWIKININFREYNGEIEPKIVQITKGGKTQLNDDTVGKLGWSEISRVDLTVNSHYWENGSRHGTNGYLRAMAVQLIEDDLDWTEASDQIDSVTDDSSES